MKHALFAAVLLTALTAVATADAQRGRGHGRGHNPYAHGHHDNGHHRGWDRHRYNGYSHGGVWYYGPPPAHLGYVEYGYRPWSYGAYLPPHYVNAFPVVDYHAHHLAPPPYGAHYVLDDRGDYLLVGITTGLIMGVIIADAH